jgi:hypothetical protein
MKTQILRFAFLFGMALAGLLTFGATPTLCQRACCEGDEWLKMSKDARESYVIAYVLGYAKGHADGCEQAFTHEPRSDDRDENEHRCKRQDLDFSKGSDFLTGAVTDFYKRFPDSRDLYIYEILNALGKNLTLDEIRKYPFLRHKVPN